MIVEDDVIIAKIIQISLEGMGYQVTRIVKTGEDAILKAKQDRPDLILMDIHLIGPIDGIEAAKNIRSTLFIPIVFLTSHADNEILLKAREAEPYGYLVKPFQDLELKAAIEMALYKSEVEAKLRESEERFRTVADFTYDWEFWIGTNYEFKYISPSCERITGYPAEEFIKRPILMIDITHPEDKDRLINCITDKNNPNEAIDMEYRIITKNNEMKWVSLCCRPVFSKDGKWLGYRGSNRDITHKKKLEEELLHLKKFEMIATLSGGIAHDFNNLLTIILGYIDIALMDIPPNTNTYKSLIEAETAIIQSKDLTQKFITLSKGDQPTKKTGDIQTLIVKCAQTVRMSEKIQYQFLFPDDLWLIAFDYEQMKTVFRNIFENAVEAMPNGGTIEVAASNILITNQTQKPVLSMLEGKYIKITIRDTGIGIASQDLPKVFDPYYSTKQRGCQKGMGLGLAIVYSIVTKHGGYVQIQSQLSVGTILTVYLPV